MKFRIIDWSNRPDNYLRQGQVFTTKDEARKELISFHEVDNDLEMLKKLTLEEIFEMFYWDVEIIPEVKFSKLLDYYLDDEDDRRYFAENIMSELSTEGKVILDGEWIKKQLQSIPMHILEGFDEFCEFWDDDCLDPSEVAIIDVPGQIEGDVK